MKYHSTISRADNWQLLESIWNRIHGLSCIYVFLFYVSLSYTANNWKYLNYEISHKKKIGPTKYPRETVLDKRNTHEKNFEPTNYPRGKVLEPWYTHEKKFRTHKIPTKPRCHDGTRTARTTITRDPRNLAHSIYV